MYESFKTIARQISNLKHILSEGWMQKNSINFASLLKTTYNNYVHFHSSNLYYKVWKK